jgi:hypothetical protein
MVKHMLALALVCLGTAAHAGDAEERAEIKKTALDYIDGWYEGDGARMARALHPELAKRIMRVDPKTGDAWLEQMGATTLTHAAGAGWGAKTPKEKREDDVQVLDVFGNAASVRITAGEWIDYLHMSRWKGHWVIVNVLWEMKPQAK